MTAVPASKETLEAEEAKDRPRKPTRSGRRSRTPLLMGTLLSLALVGAGTYYLVTKDRETTDDAQVEGRVMNVSARVSGQVLHVRAFDNQVVNAGDVLIELDPADYAAKVDLARADLEAARAAAEGARSALALTEKTAPANIVQAEGGMTAAASSVTSARASIEQAKADIAAAESQQALAELNARRSSALFAQNAISTADNDARRTELDHANAALEQARARLESARAGLSGSNGAVVLARGRLDAAATSGEQLAASRAAVALAAARAQQAEAALKLAELNLSYTSIKAARRGVVSRRTVEEGQMVNPERSLLAIVPLDDVWIVANFKEDQLAKMQTGQRATIRVDAYGGRKLEGHVDSIAGGTGARFALLPPDNATGNFVKVVQRVPVLIRLDGSPGIDLRPGMSADVTVRLESR